MNLSHYLLFALVFAAGYAVQGTTGFGAATLSLPILAFFFPPKVLIAVIIGVNLFQSGWLAFTERQHLDQRQALIMILFALIGLPLGYLVYRDLSTEKLKIVLGGFVVLVAISNLAGGRQPRPWPSFLYYPLLFLGGVTEGALANGGPFIVIYAERMIKDKSAFRATLSLLWSSLNVVMCGIYTATGTWTREMVPLMLIALPCIALGTWLGQILHHRLPEKPFRALVFAILLLAGLVLLRPLFG